MKIKTVRLKDKKSLKQNERAFGSVREKERERELAATSRHPNGVNKQK